MNDRPKPHVDNAPGLSWRLLKGGWEARWRPRADLVKRGLEMVTTRLWCGWEPTELECRWMADCCRQLQDEMLVWGRGGLPTVASYDGTIAGLVAAYQADPDSPFHKLRYRTRQNYALSMRRLVREHGTQSLGDTIVDGEPVEGIRARMILRWHEEWSAGGAIAMAHNLVTMLRIVVNFGCTFLEDPECERLASVLHRLKFPMGGSRTEIITAEQANAVRAVAHAQGRHSIALGQAFQFELTLRQKDVIGEWVPNSEPELSDVVDGNAKWLRGLRWSEVDWPVLKHTTSKRLKDIEVDLRNAPMVMEELARFETLPTSGAIVIDEDTGLPYRTHQWRRHWRVIARAAGIPDHVFNMDTRAGAITEGTDVADIEQVRHAATHSNIATTQRYSRAGTKRIASVMKARAAGRNKPGTE